MKFSFEIPIHSLEKLDSEQDYLFILGHHLENQKYFDYCKNSKKFKILDNSAYELGESIPPKKLLEYAILLNVNVIILPDKIYDLKRSEQLEKIFFDELTKTKYKFKLMKVVCGDNIDEYLENLIKSAKNKKYDILGLSQSRNNLTPNLSFCMKYLTTKVKDFNKDIHLLGMTTPFEIIEAKQWKQIKTVDTGRPINFAFQNKTLPKLKKSSEYVKVSGYDIDTLNKLNVKLAKKNIRILKEYYGKDY